MQNQYTRQAERAIKYAARMARKLKHPYIGTEHLLLGLRSEITGVAGQVLASHGVDEEQLLHLMDELIVPGEEILQQDDPKEVRDWSIFWKMQRKRRCICAPEMLEQSICFWRSCMMQTAWQPGC